MQTVKKVLVDVPVHHPALRQIQQLGIIELALVDSITQEPRRLPPELLANKNILFCFYPPENIDDMVNLEWIQLGSAGYSQLFDLNLPHKGVRACNAAGVFDTAVAEWNIAMMVNLARNLRQMIRNQEARLWERSPVFQREIRNSTVGIWGYGGIGRETARLCKAMGVKVHVLTRSGIKPRNDVYSLPGTGDPEGILPDRIFMAHEKDEFLDDLDFLVLSLPLTRQTQGIVGETELGKLPSQAFLLNPARGPLTQEDALLRALRERWIAGAALDTHHHYPLPPDHSLWGLDNLIVTPHISGSSESPFFGERVWDLFLQNLLRYLRGQPLLNELSAAQLAGD